MFALALNFLRSERGATAIEYGLIAALVSVGAVVALDMLGNSLIAVFDTVSSELAQAAVAAGS